MDLDLDVIVDAVANAVVSVDDKRSARWCLTDKRTRPSTGTDSDYDSVYDDVQDHVHVQHVS